ncbi:hypothetical protein [Alteribacter aurantiacus]|uniref:hypothetical protein n=1 Tax=Alteribacter aurantiacus TaxID=254410 RepID=UPI0012EB769E|nr:hypothetical protein [Alteribacter aurantiacus]
MKPLMWINAIVIPVIVYLFLNLLWTNINITVLLLLLAMGLCTNIFIYLNTRK